MYHVLLANIRHGFMCYFCNKLLNFQLTKFVLFSPHSLEVGHIVKKEGYFLQFVLKTLIVGTR